ncbi:VolA/Pla-1 family phospholipase [Photobacterium indicum]|uniref:Lipase n=1 Tax=Photobacterium indicum TaxID=81447 RepID=A0A2T3L7M3_9GAMM|nr:VolA/Pla-1 family phospholipase [Photobacterium indicum]PSV46693.1 lipase [Photobacterium indicum]
MNKKLLALLVASTLGLTACGDDATTSGDPTLNPNIGESLKAETKINFDLVSDPSKPVIVTPTYLAMDSFDGTIKTDGDVGTEGYSTDISNPAVALGKTDGWSTNQPIIIEFTGNNLNAETAEDGFYLLETGDPSSSDYANTSPTPLTVANGDFIVSASGKTLTIIFLKPLKPASQYQFAVTSDLKDEKGNPVGMSSTYAVLKSTTPTPDMALEPAQKVAHLSEATFAAAGIDKDKIIFSNWFTTASAGDVMYAAKAASALALQKGADKVWTGTAISTDVSSEDLSKLLTMTTPIKDTAASDNNKDVYKGNVYLPYYLETDAAKFASTPWQSGMPSLASIQYVLENGPDADKAIVMAKLTELEITLEDLEKIATNPEIQLRILPLLTGQDIILSDGKPLDEERLITRYSPVPKLKSVQQVEYTLITPPDGSACQAVGANQVTIFQHGITADKDTLQTSNLPDEIISNSCNAIFAIDLPLHGTRGISLPDGSTVNASTDPSIFLNLLYLPVGRDNIRQSITDQINLRVAIGLQFARIAAEIEAGVIDPTSELNWLSPTKGVNFVGHSLGAITGIDLAYVANRTVNEETDPLLFNINKFALANPGAGIPYLLLESGSFGNFVKGTLLSASSDEFAAVCSNSGLIQMATCYGLYERSLVNSGSNESLSQLESIYSLYSEFAYASQTILDTVDPLNHAPLISEQTPVYMSMTIDDSTIPNYLTPRATVEGTDIMKPYSAFAGTLNLVSEAQLGLTPTIDNVTGDKPLKTAAFFTVGSHTSFMQETSLPPGKPATLEMQEHVASLINGDGTTLTVNNNGGILTTTP